MHPATLAFAIRSAGQQLHIVTVPGLNSKRCSPNSTGLPAAAMNDHKICMNALTPAATPLP